MFDTLTIARTLTDAGADPKLADAIADGIRQAAEHGEHVTPDMFDARMETLDARVDARIAAAETRLTWRMLGVAGLVIAALRFLG